MYNGGMANTTYLKQNWKLILNVLTGILLVVLVIGLRHQLAQTLRDLTHIHAWWVLLMIPIELVNYHAQTKQYLALFSIVGNKLKYWPMYKTSLELNFVNHVFPSGGVTGISYFGLRFKEQDISGGRATLVQFMKLAMTFLSFELLVVIGMLCLALAGRASNLTILVGTAVSTLLIVGTLVFSYIIGSKARINGFMLLMTRVLNRLIYVVRRHHPETINLDRAHHLFDDLHDNYQAVRGQYRQLLAPFWWAFLANLSEVLTIYVVFIAFGHWVNLGAVILAYAIANFAGLVSVLPGGVGIYEALMAAVLASAGVPASLSLPVIVMYRVVNTIIQVPPGYVLYHRYLNNRARSEAA
jgi:uncharacterized protein (TIRG00374 family)